MESIKYELKYCEGCGTLKLRPIKSATNIAPYANACWRAFAFRAGQWRGSTLELAESRQCREQIPPAVLRRDAGGEDSMTRRAVAFAEAAVPRVGCAGKSRYEEEYDGARADVLFFRAQTLGIVRHFFEIASQIGRLPSILGREFFRAKVSHHAIPSFEEQAVFVHDVETALARLNEQDGELVALVGLFHYSMDDVAKMLGRSRSFVAQHFADSRRSTGGKVPGDGDAA